MNRLRRRFTVLAAAGVAGGVLVGLALPALLSPAAGRAWIALLHEQAAWFALLIAATLAALALWLRHALRNWSDPLARLARAVEFALHGNTETRIVPDRAGAARDLARALNELLQDRARLAAGVATHVARARADLELERNRLAALVADLSEAVLVCNAAGDIVLYNVAARRLVRAAWGEGTLVGLGRPAAAMIGDERLRATLAQVAEGGMPVAIDVPAARGIEVGARIAAIRSEAGAVDGHVITLRLNDAEGARRLEDEPVPPAAVAPGSRPEFYDFDLFAHAVAGGPLEHRALAQLTCTVFDTETTGLDPGAGDRIIAIGAVRVVNGRVLRGETFDQFVQPGRPVPAASTRIHGIDDGMVEHAPTLDLVLPAFARFAAGTVLVAHNAAFDMRFLELAEAGSGIAFRQPVLDTLLLAGVLDDSRDADLSLEGLAARFGIAIHGRHSALGDALTTAEILLRQLPLLAARGIVTLDQALAAAQLTWQARVRY